MNEKNIFNAVNGQFTLTKLKPSFIQFAKSEISDLKRMTKAEIDVILANAHVKAIGYIGVNTKENTKSSFPKNFMRSPF